MIATSSPSDQQGGDGPDNLDRRLGAYFRREVPDPWPQVPTPVKAPVGRQRETTLSAARMALAASVAALLATGWFVHGRMSGPIPPGGSLENGSATVPSNMRLGGIQPSGRHR
jgi:hypothetical protein